MVLRREGLKLYKPRVTVYMTVFFQQVKFFMENNCIEKIKKYNTHYNTKKWDAQFKFQIYSQNHTNFALLIIDIIQISWKFLNINHLFYFEIIYFLYNMSKFHQNITFVTPILWITEMLLSDNVRQKSECCPTRKPYFDIFCMLTWRKRKLLCGNT